MINQQHTSHNVVGLCHGGIEVWAGGGGDDLAKSPHLARTEDISQIHSEFMAFFTEIHVISINFRSFHD